MILITLQDCLADVLQQDLKFIINDKTIKEGKLLLYNIKDYYIIFTLLTPKEVVKAYEIPMPFEIKSSNNELSFSYSIKTLSKDDPNKILLIDQLLKKISKKSKFYDNTLTIISK